MRVASNVLSLFLIYVFNVVFMSMTFVYVSWDSLQRVAGVFFISGEGTNHTDMAMCGVM